MFDFHTTSSPELLTPHQALLANRVKNAENEVDGRDVPMFFVFFLFWPNQ